MAAYKKKNIKKLQPSKEPKRSNIKMKQSEKSTKRQVTAKPAQINFKVVTGGKGRKNNGVIVLAVVAILLINFYSIFNLIHPIGITEYLSSSYKSIGSGRGYPVSLASEDVISLTRSDSSFYLLNRTDLHCFNINGKLISKIHHGLSKPVLETSETRALVYSQGEKLFKIYNFEKEILSIQFENELLSADIADNGNYAVASYADSYDSVVKVFNKKNEPIYEWYSASGIVSDITLTDNGNKLLVSTFIAENGVLKSKIYVLNFKSAESEYMYSFDGDVPYSVLPISNSKFFVVFEKSLELIDTKHGIKTVKSTEYSNRIIDEFGGKILLLSSLSASDDKNTVSLVDKKGNSICDFHADFTVKDATFKDNFIYLLGNSELIKLDKNGNILSSTEVSFDTKRIIPISESFVIAISNNSIEKIKLMEGAE